MRRHPNRKSTAAISIAAPSIATICMLTLLVMAGALMFARPAWAFDGAAAQSIQFGGQTYHLAWQSKPQPGYRKSEYLPKGQKLPDYRDMLLVEQLDNGMSLRTAVQKQLEFLRARKASDPVVKHSLSVNEQSGEFLLDFVLSAQDPARGTIIEWNAYRYIPRKNAEGSPYTFLYAYSRRAYGDDNATRFLEELKSRRSQDIAALIGAPVPLENRP